MDDLLRPAPQIRPAAGTKLASVCAALGPTNTGKTHHAIERMLSFRSGMIGLPLRLLAREVYASVVARVGPEAVALVTGEEKIKPRQPNYWVATVEAMPRDVEVDFVAIDEVQLGADLDRGHVFTDRLLRRRGRQETLLIGAGTMAPLIRRFLPHAPIYERPRLSRLTYAGEKKIARLPRRSAIVAFSAEDVYAIAEWIKRQRGGAAVVIGALSPRTRNAQVELYQSGEVDYIVATDAIGMGLNLDVDHVAFASDRKFDGWRYRRLTPAELGQIAGRAGRHMNDGTFGTTGRCPPFDEELVDALEHHEFDGVTTLQWRNPDHDFSSLRDLAASLDALPGNPCLARAPIQVDQLTLEALSREEHVARNAKSRADVERVWDACQIPDYQKISPGAHAELARTIFEFIVRRGKIPADFMSRQLAQADRIDGDLSTLANRLAQVRTWSFIAHRSGWMDNCDHWQNLARQVEDRISDALHERLTQRFVDRRTSVLMRRLRENVMLEAEITTAGDVLVEGQHVGSLQGLRFTADPSAEGEAAKALNAAAQKALASEFDARATRIFDAVDDAFVLGNDGTIRWLGEPVGKIAQGPSILKPAAHVLADEQLGAPVTEKVKQRLELWLSQRVDKLLGPLKPLESGEGLDGAARGVAYQIAEELGVLERGRVAREIRNFSQEQRAALRKLGVRFGAYHLYLPPLLKPGPRTFAALLWALRHGGLEHVKGMDEVPHLAGSGRTSFAAVADAPKGFYRAAGYRLCGDRVVRVDILERLADLIRPAIAYRPGTSVGEPPPGAADQEGFVVTVAMTSLTGCSGDAFASILRSLGYASVQREGPAITVPIIPAAPTKPVAVVEETIEQATADIPLEVDGEALAAAPISVEAAPVEETAQETVEETAEEAVEEAAGLVEPPPPEATVVEATHAPTDEAVAAEAAETLVAEEAPSAPEPPPQIEVWMLQPRPAAQQHRPATHEGRRREGGPQRPPRAEGAGAPPAPRPDEAQPTRSPQERREDRPRFEAPRSGHRSGGKPGQGPRGDRPPRDDGRREARQNGGVHAPRPRERQPDPDSPFAKLAALKAELEKKGKS
ncbi:MAG TPA: helicase-related protein [Methylocystis sp.]|nr:helicase-related protein [Methylocystis sp.]